MLDIPDEVAKRIAGLNTRWLGMEMPERCLVPEDSDGWRDRLMMLPGYDPFGHGRDDLRFDARLAVRCIGFFHEYLRHIKGKWAGNPIWLEPWQQAFLGNLFGWVRDDGTRRYRRWLLYIPRKNGKTLLAAGIQLHVLVNDGESGAEVYCGAADRAQARLLFDVARAMVDREPQLAALLTCYQHEIVFRQTNSVFKVLSSDAHTKHGFNVHSAILDELHTQPNRDLWEVLDTGRGSREQPLMGAITTADYERPSICNEVHDHARGVRDGRVEDWTFLPGIWEAERTDDPHSPEVWRKANPNFGVSITDGYLADESERAKRQPAAMNTFLRLHLNIRTEQAEKWMDLAAWGRLGTDPGDPSRPAFVGVDIASTEDFAAMALLWQDAHGQPGVVGVRMRFWIPEDTARDRELRGIPVRQWADAGHLTLTEGARIHYDLIEREVIETCREHGVRRPAFDPWNAEHMTQHLTDAGLEPVLFNQSTSRLSTPTKYLETLCATARIAHGGNPVLGWMMGNCTIERDGMDNIRPSKKRSTEKIDGVIALVMALGMMIQGDEPEEESVYTQRGLLVI